MSDLDVVQGSVTGRYNGPAGRATGRLDATGDPVSADDRTSALVYSGRVLRFEHRGEKIASRGVFAARVSLAVLIWLGAASFSLLVGIAGYAAFEGMSLVDAFVSAAMVLSGMGEAVTLRTSPGKIFAGAFALFSGLFMLVATGVVLAPIIHRVLHRFHVGSDGP